MPIKLISVSKLGPWKRWPYFAGYIYRNCLNQKFDFYNKAFKGLLSQIDHC